MEWHGKRKCDENEEKEGDERNNRPIGDAPEFRPIKSVDCVCVCVCVWAFHWLGPVSVIEKRRKEKEFHKGKKKKGRWAKGEEWKKERKEERKEEKGTHTHTHTQTRATVLFAVGVRRLFSDDDVDLDQPPGYWWQKGSAAKPGKTR